MAYGMAFWWSDTPRLKISSRQAMQIGINIFLPSKERLHKLQFLRKLSPQKPCRDQASLSNLVNPANIVSVTKKEYNIAQC